MGMDQEEVFVYFRTMDWWYLNGIMLADSLMMKNYEYDANDLMHRFYVGGLEDIIMLLEFINREIILVD